MKSFSRKFRISILSSVASIVVLFLLVGSGLPPLSQLPISSASASSVTEICSSSGFFEPSGIYNGTGGAFVEDANTGNLLWCAGGKVTVIAHPPSGGSSYGYLGMAGISTSNGLVLVLDSDGHIPSGMWFCFGATFRGCSSKSNFISLPSEFCHSEPLGFCNPSSSALDSKLNLYYIDLELDQVVECTHASKYQTCKILENLAPKDPVSLFIDLKGNIWVADGSCAGLIWKNDIVKYRVGDGLSAITMSSLNPTKTPHLYVEAAGGCPKQSQRIVDLTDGKTVPLPLLGDNNVQGMSSALQFTTLPIGNVYSIKDTS